MLHHAFTPEARCIARIRELCQSLDDEVLRFESLPDDDALTIIAQKAASLLEEAESLLA